MNSPSLEVGPGIGAFFAFFFLALALWLLMRNMFARLRRMNLAQREAERRAAESAEGEQDEMLRRAREMDVPGKDRSDGPGSGSDVGDGPEEGQGRRDEV